MYIMTTSTRLTMNPPPPHTHTQVAYDAEFEPVMSCVIDMAMQYCDVEGVKESDPWCSTLEVSGPASQPASRQQ